MPKKEKLESCNIDIILPLTSTLRKYEEEKKLHNLFKSNIHIKLSVGREVDFAQGWRYYSKGLTHDTLVFKNSTNI